MRSFGGSSSSWPSLSQAAQLVQALDPVGDRAPVRQQAAEPAVVDVRHADALRLLLRTASCACFFVPTKSTVPPRSARLRAKSCASSSSSRGLLEVDDVDAAALGEDEPLHLRVPAAGLVAEVDSGLQQLSHGDDSHGIAPFGLDCGACRRGRAEPAQSGRHRRPAASAGSDGTERGLACSGWTRARSSAAARSAGSGDSTSTRSPGDRVREGEPRRVQELAPRPRSPADAVDRVADDRQPDRRRGGRGSGASARSRAARAAARARPSSSTHLEVRDRVARRVGVERVRASGRRGRGRSAPRSVPLRERGRPRTSARYSRSSARPRTSSCSRS